MPKAAWGAILTLAALGASPPQTAPDPAQDVVIVGIRPAKDAPEHVPPHCYRRPDDPADAVPVNQVFAGQRVIMPDRKTNRLTAQPDREPVLGPGIWQRAGNGLGQYVFRVPDDGLPMCIGAAVTAPSGWGQLRQIISTEKGMAGKYLHFSALVAGRDAGIVRFWLVAAGKGSFRVRGGDTHEAPLNGTFGWEEVDLIVGPIPYEADHISYGVLLWGKGDVWITDAKLQVQNREELKDVPALPVSLKRAPDGVSH